MGLSSPGRVCLMITQFLLIYAALHGSASAAAKAKRKASTFLPFSSWKLPKIKWKSVQHTLNSARAKVKHATTQLDDFLFGEPCPFVEKPNLAVKEALKHKIRSQDNAINAVVGHITSWYGTEKPLVMAFTGPTGVGKTEMANVLAEAVLLKRKRVGNRGRIVPKGLLVFSGEDFSRSENDVTKYHNQIKTQLAEMLRTCDNRGVVIFDEVQKVVPGTLDVLLDAMSERPRLTVFHEHGDGKHARNGGETEVFDTSKLIFIFISDVGADEMFELILENGGRENTPVSMVENKIRSVLQAQWERLEFIQKIDGSVPFLPLEENHIRDIVELKLEELNQSGQKTKRWADLQWNDNLVTRLSGREFVKYARLKTYDDRVESSAGHEEKVRVFAKFGARAVVNGGPVQKIREILADHRRPDASATVRITARQDNRIRIEHCTFQSPDGKNRGKLDECQDNQCPVACSTKWEGVLSPMQQL